MELKYHFFETGDPRTECYSVSIRNRGANDYLAVAKRKAKFGWEVAFASGEGPDQALSSLRTVIQKANGWKTDKLAPF
jgi:hypothetical protein